MWLHAVLSSKSSGGDKVKCCFATAKSICVWKECAGASHRRGSVGASFRSLWKINRTRSFSLDLKQQLKLNSDDMFREFLISLIIRLWGKFILHEPARSCESAALLCCCASMDGAGWVTHASSQMLWAPASSASQSRHVCARYTAHWECVTIKCALGAQKLCPYRRGHALIISLLCHHTTDEREREKKCRRVCKCFWLWRKDEVASFISSQLLRLLYDIRDASVHHSRK